jgi:hypothetical protein
MEPKRTPRLLYPSHETMLPDNVAPPASEWTPGELASLFELEFRGENGAARVYTTGSRFTPSAVVWNAIAVPNRGRSLDVVVRSLDPRAPEHGFVSERVQLILSGSQLNGAAYYWSTGAQGILKARVSDVAPVKFYPEVQTEPPRCLGCHTLSRDGKKLAVVYEGESVQVLATADRASLFGSATMMPPPEMMPPPAMMPPAPMPEPDAAEGVLSGAWVSFSPDATKLVLAAKGRLRLLDGTTGTALGSEEGTIVTPEMTFAAHPDWSPLGNRLAITLATRGNGKEVEGGAIAVLPFDGTSFGTVEILVPSTAPDDNNFFPAFSPDGRYIAFVRAKGKSRDAGSATLNLLDTESGDIRNLERLNQRVGSDDEKGGLGNSMPVWAGSNADGSFWLSFSSLRGYGETRPKDKKIDQIWLAAIDPTLPDPGYAAFWAPFQSLDHGNHRAFWTDASDDTACACVDRCGDAIDNDCDGEVDEMDCAVGCIAREICGDGIDNDCNCAIDDCALTEDCEDGIDNDGDGLTDGDDAVCQIR